MYFHGRLIWRPKLSFFHPSRTSKSSNDLYICILFQLMRLIVSIIHPSVHQIMWTHSIYFSFRRKNASFIDFLFLISFWNVKNRNNDQLMISKMEIDFYYVDFWNIFDSRIILSYYLGNNNNNRFSIIVIPDYSILDLILLTIIRSLCISRSQKSQSQYNGIASQARHAIICLPNQTTTTFILNIWYIWCQRWHHIIY